ncbi:hypothetical protein EGW08_018052, partial [Elysia chlorotica]
MLPRYVRRKRTLLLLSMFTALVVYVGRAVLTQRTSPQLPTSEISPRTNARYLDDNSQAGYNHGNSQAGYNHDNSQAGYNHDNSQAGYNHDNRQAGYNHGNRQAGYNHGNSQDIYPHDKNQARFFHDNNQAKNNQNNNLVIYQHYRGKPDKVLPVPNGFLGKDNARESAEELSRTEERHREEKFVKESLQREDYMKEQHGVGDSVQIHSIRGESNRQRHDSQKLLSGLSKLEEYSREHDAIKSIKDERKLGISTEEISELEHSIRQQLGRHYSSEEGSEERPGRNVHEQEMESFISNVRTPQQVNIPNSKENHLEIGRSDQNVNHLKPHALDIEFSGDKSAQQQDQQSQVQQRLDQQRQEQLVEEEQEQEED